MKKILTTLYVTNPKAYLKLDGGNIVVTSNHETVAKLPLISFEGIVTFGYPGASPGLMRYCLEHNVALSFLSETGQFCGRLTGELNGNVLLRRAQYRVADSETEALQLAKAFLIGKLFNQRWVLARAKRDHSLVVSATQLDAAIQQLREGLQALKKVNDATTLRGIEGNTARAYFSVFGELILQQQSEFSFSDRSRRPPLDRTNALLSYAYTLLAHDCAAALEAVGLDAYVGFLHTDRPGRTSLALDLMEELRSVFADRFVLTLINKRMVRKRDFMSQEDGAVLLTEQGRRTVLAAWQDRRSEQLVHPFLKEKIQWGLVPHVQALLLARYLRGDIDAYPPFLWK
ncbi:type I-C CRISPR-associated endonuclease Cas1c [Lacticaseibacillus daqingensis]|uniref:type I-C CRISPR-associated endonuclease Cas1c n=1 Tax=Lacticaseibacillus daqingensis TaxID=2486014 RepID=UPI000F77378A|nr:type I-C CRISPR-associated endonuclease Cas1c [Lacticaseibacillus daqingensis]